MARLAVSRTEAHQKSFLARVMAPAASGCAIAAAPDPVPASAASARPVLRSPHAFQPRQSAPANPATGSLSPAPESPGLRSEPLLLPVASSPPAALRPAAPVASHLPPHPSDHWLRAQPVPACSQTSQDVETKQVDLISHPPYTAAPAQIPGR